MLISRGFLYLQENKWHFLKFAPFFIKIPKNHRQWTTENLYRERNRWSTFTISKIIYCIYIVYSVQARFSSLLRSRSGRSHESSCHAVLTIYDFWPGPAQGEGLGVGGQPPTFWKKKGIFAGKRIFDWRTSPKYPNLWLVHFDPISQGEHKREWGTLFSLGKPQNDFLYKTDLSRRLLCFHQPGDVVCAQTM